MSKTSVKKLTPRNTYAVLGDVSFVRLRDHLEKSSIDTLVLPFLLSSVRTL